MSVEHRVVWKREGLRRKAKRFVRRRNADYFVELLTSTEPWKHIADYKDVDPDDYVCCAGTSRDECACGGETIREHFGRLRGNMPSIEYVRIETREVGPWR